MLLEIGKRLINNCTARLPDENHWHESNWPQGRSLSLDHESNLARAELSQCLRHVRFSADEGVTNWRVAMGVDADRVFGRISGIVRSYLIG